MKITMQANGHIVEALVTLGKEVEKVTDSGILLSHGGNLVCVHACSIMDVLLKTHSSECILKILLALFNDFMNWAGSNPAIGARSLEDGTPSSCIK